MSLKQADGSFLVSHHGEVDVRQVSIQDILTDVAQPHSQQRNLLSSRGGHPSQPADAGASGRRTAVPRNVPNI